MSKNYALIDADNVVFNTIILADDAFFEWPGATLIASEMAKIGDSYNPETGEFVTPEAPPRFTDAISAQSAIFDMIDAATFAVTGRVPIDEKYSWITKEDASRAILAGSPSEAQTTLIATEADLMGETIEQLATKIVANADQYRVVVAKMTALRRVADGQLLVAVGGYDFDNVVDFVASELTANA